MRERLEAEPTPLLWCVLGDLKKDVEFYDRAWELSDGHFARAQRSKGLLLLRRAEKLKEQGRADLDLYRQCIDALQKSVNTNILHPNRASS